MSTLQHDVHAPHVAGLEAARDWAALLRYWMAHDYQKALGTALDLVTANAQHDAHRWAPLMAYLERVRDHQYQPAELSADWQQSDLLTFTLLAEFPKTALCSCVITSFAPLWHPEPRSTQSQVRNTVKSGRQGTMGAPAENKNAVRHGLTCGKMPPRATYIRAATNELRRVIEQAVIEKHGRIGIYEAAVIQSCVRWERHSLLCTKWLREEYDRLDPEQRLSFSRDAAKASESRDRCLKSLGLDRLENHDDFGRLYSGPVEAAPSHFTGGGDAAPQNGTRAPAGAIVCDLESDGGLTCELPSSAHPNTDAGL